MDLLKLQDLELNGKKALIRVDFNVPLDKNGAVADDTRIREALPSIRYVLEKGGSVILMSHLGRPKGKPDPAYTLQPVADKLQLLLGTKIQFAGNIDEAKEKAALLNPGEVLLLENLRFSPAEEKPELDPLFAKDLASLGDVYINDAFGTAHRAHSSTAAIAAYFEGRRAAGMLMQKEINFLEPLVSNPKHPFYAIIGGAKVSSKIGVLRSLVSKVDEVFIGGGMAYTFLKAQGIPIGNSLCEEEHVQTARDFFNECSEKNVRVWLPTDLIIADAFDENAAIKIIDTQAGIPERWQGMDIGPKTLNAWENAIRRAATVFWNGPLGVFELRPFASGTEGIARALAALSNATTIVGGGDSVAAISGLGLSKNFSHISTGGGASLEFLEFGSLPGINALAK